jgi:hypothetical protein
MAPDGSGATNLWAVFSRPGATGASDRKRGFDASPSARFQRLQHFPDGSGAGTFPALVDCESGPVAL